MDAAKHSWLCAEGGVQAQGEEICIMASTKWRFCFTFYILHMAIKSLIKVKKSACLFLIMLLDHY